MMSYMTLPDAAPAPAKGVQIKRDSQSGKSLLVIL